MEETTEIRDTPVFMVAGGGAPRWFASESAAREYLGDRFADADAELPFLITKMMSEAFLRLNELEKNNRLA